MSLTAEQREKLLRVLDQTGAKRSPDLKTSAVPKDYAAYMEKVERSEVTLECPAVGVPVQKGEDAADSGAETGQKGEEKRPQHAVIQRNTS